MIGGGFDRVGIMGGGACGMIHDLNVVMSRVGKLGAGAGMYGLRRSCSCWESWLLFDGCEWMLFVPSSWLVSKFDELLDVSQGRGVSVLILICINC